MREMLEPSSRPGSPEDRTAQALPSPPEAARRVEWIDLAKGITIILVVMFHTLRGLGGAGMLASDRGYQAVDFAVYSFHMPAFFFLSGLFMERTLRRPARSFWISRVRVLLLPYFIWMTVELVFLAVTSSLVNMHGFSPSVGVYLWHPIAPFWFLYALFCISAALYLLRNLPAKVVFSIAILAYAAAWVSFYWFGDGGLEVQTASGFVFVSLGMLLAGHVQFAQSQSRAAVLTLILFAGVAAASFPFYLEGLRPEASLPSALLGVAGIVVLSQWLEASPLSAWLEPLRFLGRISLTILVVHILGTAGARILLAKFAGIDDVPLHLFADTLAGLAIGIAVQWAAWSAGLTRWLGLPDEPVRLAWPTGARPSASARL